MDVLALVAGLLLLSFGAGLGPRHLAVEGVTATALVGLTLLLVGLVAFAWMAVRLLAAVRRRWWVPLLALLLVGACLALWTLGQAVAATFPPRPELGARTPADLELTHQEVTFPSADGTELTGWWVPGRNGAALALLHGAGSTRSDVLEHAAVLAGHGYGVLLFDARGHGRSAGRGMDFGWYGESDVAGALDFLAGQAGVSPGRLGLVGLSMGGEEAIGAAGVDDRVAAVVAEGATNRVAADKGYLAAYGTRGALQQQIDRVTFWLTALLGPAPEPRSLRRSVEAATSRPDPTAFLLITAGRVPDEALAASYIGGADSSLVQTWNIRGAGHTDGLGTAPPEWEERVTSFLDRRLE